MVEPLGARVLVRLIEEASMTPSGLVLPDTAKDAPQRGEVVAVGDDEEMIKVAVGDRVYFAKYTGTELRLDGIDYLILEAADLLAVIRETGAGVSAA
ncbi:MAG: co-chaperone GroES [Candidatus Nanopelagicales bacterium]